MISKEITICINPGVECKSLHVDWIGTEGLIKPCITPNCITVAIDPNNPTQCLEGFIVCLDENGNQSCKNCEPIHFRKCFCTLDSDCGDCGNCGPDGMCVDICSPIETAQGKVCYPDGCKCPPNKPVLDPKTGKCAQCVSGSVDPKNPCRICVDGEWITKDCGTDAVCDQTTGDCIPDCSKNINGRTFWNPITKQCECETGYRWSTVKNTCVVDEPCSEGYRRNPITDDCEKINCPPGQIYDPITDNCIDKPCDPKNCETGLDCEGKNCGCGPDKKCVSCKDNPNALGCKDNEDECKREYCDDENPCKGPNCTCVDNKCVGCSNFPCDKCGQQVGCKCEDGANCSGTDDEDDCKDELKVEMKDCSLMTQLKLQKPCNCPGIGASVKVSRTFGARLLPLTTLENGITPYIPTLGDHYLNFEVDLRDKFSNNTTGYELLNRFLESNTDVNNDFPDTANCSLEITAFFKDKDGVIFSTPAQTLSSEIKSGTIGSRITVVKFENFRVGTSNPLAYIGANGLVVPKSACIGYQISIYIGDIKFTDKNCSYNRTRIYKTNTNAYESLEKTTNYEYITLASLSSSDKRNPLLTIKRDNEVIRKLYITPTSPGVYDDFLHGPKRLSLLERGIQNLIAPQGELISLKDYHFEWDCGCDRTKSITQLVKCDLKEFLNDKQFKISTSDNSDTCNNKITLLQEHLPCPINQDLEYFGWGANHPSQTKYTVEITDIDGSVTKVGTFLYKNTTDTTGYFRKDGTNEKFIGYTFVHTKQIVSAKITMNHDPSCTKQDSIDLNIKEADITLSCIAGKVTATIKSTGTLIKHVEIPALNIESATNNNGTTTVTLTNLPENTDITFVITYLGNCKRSQTLSKNCCDSDSLILNTVGTVGKELTVKTQNNAIITDILINDISKFNDFTLSGSTYSISTDTLGNPITVSVRTQTLTGCNYSISDYNLGDNYDISFQLAPNIVCSGGVSSIEITGGPPNKIVTVRDPNLNNISILLDNSGNGSESNITVAGDYYITQIGTELIGVGVIPKQTLIVQNSVIVTSVALELNYPSGICSNTDHNVIITGTLGSTVEVMDIAPGYSGTTRSVDLNTPVAGSSDLGYGTLVYNFGVPGTYTITTGQASLNNCNSITSATTTVTVNSSPEILNAVGTCIAPLSSTSDTDITVTLSSYSGIANVVVRDLSNNQDITLVQGSLPTIFDGTIFQGSGKNVLITATIGSCVETLNYTLPVCSCTNNPASPIFNNFVFCVLNESVSPSSTAIFSGGLNVIDLYFGTTLVKTLTITDSSYAITSGSQFGTYSAVTRNTTTGCLSTPTTFTVGSRDWNVDLNIQEVVPYCSGSSIPMSAVVTVNGVTSNPGLYTYKWFVDGIEIVGQTSSNYTYNSSTTDLSSKTFRVEARAINTTSSNSNNTYYSSSCVAEDQKVATFINCCPTVTATYNSTLSTQCSGMRIDVSAPVGTDPTSALYYEVYQPASSTTPLVTGTTYLNFGSFNIDKNDLIPGNNQYRIVVGFVSNVTCKTEITVTHNSGLICEAINYVFIVDNSGSITTGEFTSISNQIKSLSQSIYNDNNNSYFALAHYYSTSSLTHLLPIENVGQNAPITTITRASLVFSDYLQESLALFDINDFTGLNPTLPIKIFIFTDAVGSGGSTITGLNISWNTTNQNDNVLPAIGANYIGGPNALDTYSVSDVLKTTYDIFVIRYPHDLINTQIGPYASSQAVSDYMLTQVASPGKFFASSYSSNAAILQVLQTLGCNC